MFGLLETEHGIPTMDDPAVREAVAKANRTRVEVERLEADEARLLRVLHPAPNAPDPSEDAREEAARRLDIQRGTQSGWFLPELKTARDAHRLALAELAAARSEAVAKLDTARREGRKALVADAIEALDGFVSAKEALTEYDTRWDLDRAVSQPIIERSTMEPVFDRADLERLKAILREQGWL